ncbi:MULTISPECIES: TnpV protein [Clostridia]|uniref:TnpV protein n=2 Tax=Bacillota TaxID=1239 RepID=UPI002A820BDD|nr:TnpV protein [Enterocloster bolteae]
MQSVHGCFRRSRKRLVNTSRTELLKGAQIMSEMTYRQAGDYRIPNIRLENEETRPLGKYGRMRRAFLEQNNPMLLNDMILTETLFPHLWEIEETAKARVELLMNQYLKNNPAPEKETDQRGWARHMSSLKAQAEEIVMTELINS